MALRHRISKGKTNATLSEPTICDKPESAIVYHAMINYLSSYFPTLSEEKLRRLLLELKKEKADIFTRVSLPLLIQNIRLHNEQRSHRWAVLQTFTEPATICKGAKSSSYSECSICFEDVNPAESSLLTCSHTFHYACLTAWLKSQRSCPLCRKYTVAEDEFPSLS